MLREPGAQQGKVQGFGDAPFVQSGDQWIGYDNPSYIDQKVIESEYQFPFFSSTQKFMFVMPNRSHKG